MTKRSNDDDDDDDDDDVVVVAVLGMVDERNDRLGGVVVVVGVTEVSVLDTTDTDVSVVPMAGGASSTGVRLLLLVVAYPRASFALLSLVLEPFFFLVMTWLSGMIDTSTYLFISYIIYLLFLLCCKLQTRNDQRSPTSRHWIVF